MFGFYKKHILPKKLFAKMGSLSFNKTRKEIVESAEGVVLEIGFGSGFNIPFYNIEKVSHLYALEPSKDLYELGEKILLNANIKSTFLNTTAESIPLPDNSVDTVVSTWVLCSVHKPESVLNEIHRILKPGGRFIFVEHGLSPNRIYSCIQKIVTPISKHLTGNCHLDRNIKSYVNNSKLTLSNIQTAQEDGRPLMYSYKGVATKS